MRSMSDSRDLLGKWISAQKPSKRKQIRYWRLRWRSALMRILEKILIGNSLSTLVVRDFSSLSRFEAAMNFVEEIELLEDARLIERTFDSGGTKFPTFCDSRRAIFRYSIKDAVVHLESGLANVCGGFLVEELMESLADVFGGGTAVHEYHATNRPSQRFDGYWTVVPIPRFYYHFITQTLPTLLREISHVKLQGILASEKMPSWARDAIETLNVPVLYLSNKTVEIEHYVCCSVPQITSKSDVLLLREKYAANLSKQGRNLAFIGRGNRNRNLGTVEDKIANFVESHGGSVVDPELLGWKEELEFFSGVDRLILVYGSASANVIWMKPGTKVLVLCRYGTFSTQIEKSMYLAADITYIEFNSDGLHDLSEELKEEIIHFIAE